MPHPRPDPSASGSDALVESTDPAQRALVQMLGPRVPPSPPPPWTELAASGWRPSPGDVRRGFALAAPGRPVTPLVPASRFSAILLLVCPGPNEAEADKAHIVLIERSRSSGSHRGDIAFPGGVLDEGESPEDAALREANEEIGVRPEQVEIIASLDMVATQTGYVISPFVGMTGTYPSFVVERAEIERVLVVPLADLAREGAHWFQTYSPDPHSTQPFFAVGDSVGWGTTGALLIQLLTAAAAGHRMRGR